MMTWRVEWGGRATDFVPDLLKTSGKPGRVAQAASCAVYEALQHLGERDPQAWVKVTAKGQEDPENPGLGGFTVEVNIIGEEPSEIQRQVEAQQPIDLLREKPA